MVTILAKIGSNDLASVDDLIRRAIGDLLPGHQHHEPLREAHHRAHDVLDQDDGDAALVELD